MKDGTTFFFSRHSIRLDVEDKTWSSRSDRPYDTPISFSGVERAIKLGEALKGEGITHIFSSPFLRAVQTAHLVAEQLDLPIKLEAGLCEILRKRWFKTCGPAGPQFLPPEEFKRHYDRVDLSYQSQIKPKFPEGGQEVIDRTAATGKLLSEQYGSHIFFVGHGISIKRLAQSFTGYNVNIRRRLAGLTKIRRENNKWRVLMNAQVFH